MNSLPYILEVDHQEVIVMPDRAHEFTATTEQVALGYGVTPENIRKHKETKAEELIEGKHFLSSVSNTHAGNLRTEQTLWTKRGIIRLGFFIRSKRARLFRDMAEDLVLSQITQQPTPAGALISARLIGESTGQTRNAAGKFVQSFGVKPVGYYIEKDRMQAANLFLLSDVERIYAERQYPVNKPFQPFTGEIMRGLPKSRKPLGRPRQQQQPPFTPLTEAERIGAQLARELTEEFIRDELPKRLRGLLSVGVGA